MGEIENDEDFIKKNMKKYLKRLRDVNIEFKKRFLSFAERMLVVSGRKCLNDNV
jgi:ABC-type Zn uptake system ZnuABC Zn-binding protein ZnuA